MNAFADVLFSVLLGWMRSFVGEVWRLVSSGAGDGVISWLGQNWLWLVVTLCVAGTVIDYAVWVIRWRPHERWRALRGARGGGKRDRLFTRGYSDGMGVSWYAQNDPIFEDAEADEAYAPDAQPIDSFYDESAYMPPSDDDFLKADTGERHRRSERRAGGKHVITGRLTRDDADIGMLDGLPPLVDKEQAYHAPVYPDAQPIRRENPYDGG